MKYTKHNTKNEVLRELKSSFVMYSECTIHYTAQPDTG